MNWKVPRWNAVRTPLLLLALIGSTTPSYGQHACIRGLGMENNQIWWTGSRNSKYLMDFTGGAPVLTTEDIGQTISIEATAVYTTATGELLLYTDGNFIFDGRTHQEIGRGVGGNPSSTEAALIVPVPEGDPTNDFYVFGNTSDTAGEINYTRVDIRAGAIDEIRELDEGRLFGESLGTVPHANGIDFWILSVTYEDPTLNAYLITRDGVSDQALTSRLPRQPGGSENVTANRGSIVYHPPSGRLATTFHSQGSGQPFLYIANFDETTGKASSFEIFEVGGYGVAFSPEGTKLYFSKGYRGQFQRLDLGTDEVSVIATGRWALPRLAPDGKIYVVSYNSRTMGMVDNPDAAFPDLVWNPEGIELPEGASAAYSLPNQVYAPCVVNYSEPDTGVGHLSVVIAGDNETATSQGPESIGIVLDMSGSMWGQIEGRPKYEVAREIVATAVRELSSDLAVGVRVYGHRGGDCRDSELLGTVGRGDRSTLLKSIESLKPRKGKTPIGYSLEQVADDLGAVEGEKAIVLVSDGLETCGGDPVAAAKALCAAGVGVRVHTVGFDVGDSPEAVEQLEAVASAGCGRSYSAANATELRQALRAAGPTSFTLVDPESEERWTGVLGASPIAVPSGIYRLTLETEPPVDLGMVEIEQGSTTVVRLSRTADGLRPSE